MYPKKKIIKAGICFVSAMHKMEYSIGTQKAVLAPVERVQEGEEVGICFLHVAPPVGHRQQLEGFIVNYLLRVPIVDSPSGGGGARPGSARAVLAARKGFFASCCVIFCG